MADDEPRLDGDPPVIDVEVRAADPRRLDPHDRVVVGQGLRVGTLLEPDLARSLKGDRTHGGGE
jgi:hypothetical protein